jgi:hypothetical protein
MELVPPGSCSLAAACNRGDKLVVGGSKPMTSLVPAPPANHHGPVPPNRRWHCVNGWGSASGSAGTCLCSHLVVTHPVYSAIRSMPGPFPPPLIPLGYHGANKLGTKQIETNAAFVIHELRENPTLKMLISLFLHGFLPNCPRIQEPLRLPLLANQPRDIFQMQVPENQSVFPHVPKIIPLSLRRPPFLGPQIGTSTQTCPEERANPSSIQPPPDYSARY